MVGEGARGGPGARKLVYAERISNGYHWIFEKKLDHLKIQRHDDAGGAFLATHARSRQRHDSVGDHVMSLEGLRLCNLACKKCGNCCGGVVIRGGGV